MSTQKSKNEVAWEALFTERKILADIDTTGIHRIPAAAINVKREARLMTKFDHRVNLPGLFAENGLAILPESRRSYVIGRFDCYSDIEPVQDEIAERDFPVWIQSLSFENLYSESAALLCAYHAGLVADVLGQDNLAFTLFGRMSTGMFGFSIREAASAGESRRRIEIDRAQCEIDGGFEGVESLAIIEVKNQEVEDFHIRQLYYPYRLWHGKLGKRVIPVFLTYSNEVFTFRVYDFGDPTDYNSLELITCKRYQIVPREIELEDIRHILGETIVKPDPEGVPFPQADRFERVIDLLARLQAAGGTLTQDEITTNNAFDIRQTQYYTNAGRYLGLVERIEDGGISYNLTPDGARLMSRAPRARNLELVRLIVSRRVFRDTLNYYLDTAVTPTRDEVKGLMVKAGLTINDTTLTRRAQSVTGWIRWIVGITSEP